MWGYQFIHLVVYLTTGPKPLPKRALHIVRSRASSFKWEYPLLSLRSSSSFLRLLPRLPVTSIHSFIFPSITRWRRQFLHKMLPIQLAFRFLISCRIFLCSLTLSNTSSFLTWSVQLIFTILLQYHISKLFFKPIVTFKKNLKSGSVLNFSLLLELKFCFEESFFKITHKRNRSVSGCHSTCKNLTACAFRPMSGNMAPYLTKCKMADMTMSIGHYPEWDDFSLWPHFLLLIIHFNTIFRGVDCLIDWCN